MKKRPAKVPPMSDAQSKDVRHLQRRMRTAHRQPRPKGRGRR